MRVLPAQWEERKKEEAALPAPGAKMAMLLLECGA